MDSMNISLPGPLKAFVDAQVAEGRHGSVSEYIRELIRGDEKRKARDRLENMLLAGLATPETEWSSGHLDDIRREASRPA